MNVFTNKVGTKNFALYFKALQESVPDSRYREPEQVDTKPKLPDNVERYLKSLELWRVVKVGGRYENDN